MLGLCEVLTPDLVSDARRALLLHRSGTGSEQRIYTSHNIRRPKDAHALRSEKRG